MKIIDYRKYSLDKGLFRTHIQYEGNSTREICMTKSPGSYTGIFLDETILNKHENYISFPPLKLVIKKYIL